MLAADYRHKAKTPGRTHLYCVLQGVCLNSLKEEDHLNFVERRQPHTELKHQEKMQHTRPPEQNTMDKPYDH
jgi:hypothetical protein